MYACTIIAKNHLAQARVPAASFPEHNPGKTLSVLVVGEVGDCFDPAVVWAQVIEHLPYEQLLRFFELFFRFLRPGEC